MDRPLDLPAGGGAARFALEISRATQLANISLGILHHFLALDNVSVLQPHLSARLESKIFRWRCLHEIRALDEEFAAERNSARAGIRILGIIDRLELLDLIFRIVCDDDFDRSKHRKSP